MQRRQFTSGVLSIGALGLMSPAWGLSEGDAVAGVRSALERGAGAAVSLLGRQDGFLANPKVKIGLPGSLEKVAKLLKATGQGRAVDDLVVAMNRAAEAAVPEGRLILVNAVKSMSVEDAVGIVRGGDNAVTTFFERKTRVPLGEKFLPIVTRATEKVALAPKLDKLLSRGAKLGLVKGEDADLRGYVTGKTLDGLYFVIGEEERRIRRDPIGTGSAILKKVFGG